MAARHTTPRTALVHATLYHEFERRIDDDERRRLLAWLPPVRPFFRELGSELLVEILGVSVGVGIATFVLGARPIVIWLAIGAYVFFNWVYRLKAKLIEPWRKHTAIVRKQALFRNAVEAAETVRVQYVESNEVVEVPHDEGTVYLFNVGDNATYWIDPRRPCSQWPNSKFELTAIPSWDEEIGPFCFGTQLKVRESIHFSEFDFEKLSYGPLINRPLDMFLKEASTVNH